MDSSTPGLPVLHYLLDFAQSNIHWVSDAIQPSHPLLSPSPPTFNLSQHQGLFLWVGSSHQMASAAASVLPMNIQGWFPRGWLLSWHLERCVQVRQEKRDIPGRGDDRHKHPQRRGNPPEVWCVWGIKLPRSVVCLQIKWEETGEVQDWLGIWGQTWRLYLHLTKRFGLNSLSEMTEDFTRGYIKKA